MKRFMLGIIFIVINLIAYSQVSAPVYNDPVYKRDRYHFVANFSTSLNLRFMWLGTTKCINAFYLVKFNVDESGRVCNIRFSSDSLTENDALNFEGVDNRLRADINKDFDSILHKTDGH